MGGRPQRLVHNGEGWGVEPEPVLPPPLALVTSTASEGPLALAADDHVPDRAR